MKRDLVRRVGGTLLGAVAILAILPACAGSTTAASAPKATTTAAQPAPAAGGLLAQGKTIFEKTAGGVGCAYCHGMDAKGNGPSGLQAPNIRGKQETDVRDAIKNLAMMSIVKLNDQEITAVVAYLQLLNTQP